VAGNSPTGTVQFQINNVNFGAPVPLINGVATVTTNQLTAPGASMITATYSGDLNNAGGASSTGFSETVIAADSGDRDVPLPAWSLILLGAGLLSAMRRAV
jgi:hypothetical protein